VVRTKGDEDVRTTKHAARRTEAGTVGDGGSEHRAPPVVTATADAKVECAVKALSNLLLRDDGWVRAIPDGAGKTAYLKWKFSRGQFAGSYVMVVVRPWDWEDGFRMLEAKIDNCYAGNRRPTPDRSYLPIFDDEELPG
jgi:hypothetical protein